MICSKKQRPAAAAAAAIAKTARACDSCVCRRAWWYCAADDAFLCQNCDSSVHSANPLVRRHNRVRLQSNPTSKSDNLAPSWHHGFMRKARTPRLTKAAKIGGGATILAFVPEIDTSGEDGSNEEEQLLYRVPIFDPVLAKFCSPPLACHETANTEAKPIVSAKVVKSDTNSNGNDQFLAGFLQPDAELAEFAADMDSLLGRRLDNDSFSMEELGLVDAKYSPQESGHVKEEYLDNDVAIADDKEKDLSRETQEINFDCRSGDDEEQQETMMVATEETANEEYREGKKIGLRLDYEAIAAQWSANGTLSPWVNGERPQFGPDDCWLDYMGMRGGGEVQGLVAGDMGGIHFDEGREARVTRYREKRRTRLFSKKIRYEVRKLNAEKRPRMKGRFVKRASFAAAAAAGAPVVLQVLRRDIPDPST